MEPQQMLIIGMIWVLNLAISFWNARVVGLAWIEVNAVGGFRLFMAWMGGVMAAVGFSWSVLIFAAIGARQLEYLSPEATKVSLELGYVILIPFVLFSGYAITLDSWAAAFRQGGWRNYGVSVYNTAATLHNTYEAYQSFGPALSSVVDYFTADGSSGSGSSRRKSDRDEKATVILLVLLSCLAGVIITVALIRSYAGSAALAKPSRDEWDREGFAR